MSEIRVATRYAKSLFDLALDKGILDKVEQDARLFIQTCEQSRQFDNLLNSPIITPDKKLSVIKKLFAGQLDSITLSFIDIVMRKRREMLLRRIFAQFTEMYKVHKGILTATVTTAVPIDDSLKADIKKMLQEKTNSSIDLKTRVNGDLLGGFVLQYEDKLVDASVSSQLKALRNHLLNNN